MRSRIKLIAEPVMSDRAGRKPTQKFWLGVVMSLSVFAFLWISFWPQLQGKYVVHAASPAIDLTIEIIGDRVTISDGASGDAKVSVFEGRQAGYEIRFGTGLESQAVVYHPLERSYQLVTGSQSTVIEKQIWIARFARSHPYSMLVAMAFFMIVYMVFVLNEKAKSEPEVIYPMWLAYFSALFGSAGILIAAGESGIFGFDGIPRNAAARAILAATDFFLGIGEECWILLGLLAFMVLVQYSAYALSGISGAAQRPRYILLTGKWVALLVAKAFIGASAIVFSVETIGGHFLWVSTEPHFLAANILLSLMLLFLGLCIFCMIPLRKATARPVGRNIRRFHRTMRRRMRKSPNDVVKRVQKGRTSRMLWQWMRCCPCSQSDHQGKVA